MDIEQFETYGMAIGITLLVGWMFFIIYDLGKRSKAGKFGMFVLFFALGLGVFGFLAKTVIIEVLGL